MITFIDGVEKKEPNLRFTKCSFLKIFAASPEFPKFSGEYASIW